MHRKKGFEFQKKKILSECEIRDILKTVEWETEEKAKRKKPQSYSQLQQFCEQDENQDDQECQVEFKLNSTSSVDNQQMPSLVSIYTSESNISFEEEFEIWEGTEDIRVIKIVLEDEKPSIGQFLQLYKARFGGFPGQQQCIQNEEVIKTAVSYASSSKQLLKKYFPSKKIVFEDDNDYSEPYKIEDDQHFQTFNHFFNSRNQKNIY
ncbi:unnamed protein product [Paramecium sonneborni]|uniref:Uncharacterized protein n=1 Tax=Paramecium sonneborni TaxID=65129 RepID=A0A8S1R5P6_9CILI|nr:unnamed protein product [Paramecium sonneborni]